MIINNNNQVVRLLIERGRGGISVLSPVKGEGGREATHTEIFLLFSILYSYS